MTVGLSKRSFIILVVGVYTIYFGGFRFLRMFYDTEEGTSLGPFYVFDYRVKSSLWGFMGLFY